MISRTVGATSPRTPSVFLRLYPSGALAMTNGTLLRVWEVLGVFSAVSISSALLCMMLAKMVGHVFLLQALPVIGGDE